MNYIKFASLTFREEDEESVKLKIDVAKSCDEDIVESKDKEMSDITQSTEETSNKDHTESTSDRDVHVGSGDSNKDKPFESVIANDKNGGSSKTEHLEEKLEELHVHEKSATETSTGETGDKHQSEEVEELSKINESEETTCINNTNTEFKSDNDNVEKKDNEMVGNCDEAICDTVNNVDGSREQVKQIDGAGSTHNVEQDSEPKVWTKKWLKAEWRRFNLDLSPKVNIYDQS